MKTWFTTDGSSLIQHVAHDVPGIVYPVTADPVWKQIVNFIGGCIGWKELSQVTVSKGVTWLALKSGAKYISKGVFSRFIPGVGWVMCGVGGFAAI